MQAGSWVLHHLVAPAAYNVGLLHCCYLLVGTVDVSSLRRAPLLQEPGAPAIAAHAQLNPWAVASLAATRLVLPTASVALLGCWIALLSLALSFLLPLLQRQPLRGFEPPKTGIWSVLGDGTNSNVPRALRLGMSLVLLGAWLGAITEPLDWPSPWFHWPLGSCVGATVGLLSGLAAAVLLPRKATHRSA